MVLTPADELGAPPTGVPFRTLDVPNVLEAEPNDDLEAATPAELPAALCGVVERAGDVDRYRFAAKKDEVWDFQLGAAKPWPRPTTTAASPTDIFASRSPMTASIWRRSRTICSKAGPRTSIAWKRRDPARPST
jgi:hypothetical protein